MKRLTITDEEAKQLHRRYASDDAQLEEVFTHCQIVREIALWCADRIDVPINKEVLNTACLLHDIASYGFLHDSYARKYYCQHALLGSAVLQEEGFDPKICEAVKTHVLLGITAQEIEEKEWALPLRDFEPKTIEAELLCYADRFSSKPDNVNSFDYFLRGLKENLPRQAAKFKQWSKRFGVPDTAAIARKYKQNLR